MRTEQVIAGWIGSVVVAGALWASDGVLTDHGIVSHSNLLEILRQTQAALSATSNPVAPTNLVTSPAVPARTDEVAPVQVPADQVAPVLAPAKEAAPVPAETAEATPLPQEHLLGSEDVIEIVVQGEPELSLARAVVSNEGTIEYPHLGTLPLGGKTVEQARVAIHEILARDYLVHPQVTVRLLESPKTVASPVPQQDPVKAETTATVDSEAPQEATFTILNQVYKPGTYVWPSQEKLTLVKAIGMARGVTRKSALAKITILRVVGGEKKTIPLNLEQSGGPADAAEFLIQPGDVIEVGSKTR